MAQIFLSIPVLDRPELKMLYSTYQSILSCGVHKVRMYFNENDSLISRVRNVHISAFLDEFPECDYFCSLDSDIEIVNTFHTNNIFTKLIANDVDFVGGLYALKQNGTHPQCSSIPLSPSINRENIPFDSGLIEMRWLSSGCWCLKRSVVEKMVKAYPELTYMGDDNAAGKAIYGLYKPDIFEIESNGRVFKKYLSEDWAMVERWRKIGGKVYADTSIVLKHIGKTSHTLWNVEVVKRNQKSEQEEPEKIEQPKNNELPLPGFDLNKQEAK